jgi:hypothetical protein
MDIGASSYHSSAVGNSAFFDEALASQNIPVVFSGRVIPQKTLETPQGSKLEINNLLDSSLRVDANIVGGRVLNLDITDFPDGAVGGSQVNPIHKIEYNELEEGNNFSYDLDQWAGVNININTESAPEFIRKAKEFNLEKLGNVLEEASPQYMLLFREEQILADTLLGD